MEIIVTFLKTNWFGVVSLVGGVLASYIFYRRSLKEAKFIIE
jgi:hypothetical protein